MARLGFGNLLFSADGFDKSSQTVIFHIGQLCGEHFPAGLQHLTQRIDDLYAIVLEASNA